MGEILSFGSSSKFKTDLGGNMRIIIVGGIAAGMSAAAKLRRTDRDAEIVVYENLHIYLLELVDYLIMLEEILTI